MVVVIRRRWFNTSQFDDRIRAVLLGSIAWGCYLVLVSETLSLFKALSPGPLIVSWLLPIPLLGWQLRSQRTPVERLEPLPLLSHHVAMLTVAAVIVACLGTIAWVAAPNTWDSMTYHLPRVMHWAQNQSLASYATHEPRQLYMSPWAEFTATHFQILSNSDRFANLIQWFSMIGGLLATWVLVGKLGGSLQGRVLSVLIAVTIPMGLLQAVSTQTDHAVGFYILATLILLSDAETADLGSRQGKVSSLGAAAGTGLAALTKATAYLFLAPFLAVFAGRMLWRHRMAAWRPLLTFGAIVLLVNLGHYSRNSLLYKSPLTPVGLGQYHEYGLQSHHPAMLLSNASRSAAVHLTLPAPTFVNQSFDQLRRLHQWLGVDPEDPRTTWPGMRFAPPPVLVHEDFSGNFLHGLLILGALALIGCRPQFRREHPKIALYALLVITSFLLFAGYLKWAPWHARLHLSLFWLWAPLLGVAWTWRIRPLGTILATLLVAQALPFLASNPLHPLWGDRSIFATSRTSQLFLARPQLGTFYTAVAARLASSGCRDIGLSMPPDAWEYPLWAAVREAVGTTASKENSLRFESLEPEATSRKLLDPTFVPCAVVCVRCAPHRRDLYVPLFGEPVVVSGDDLAHSPHHMFFLR